MSGSYHALRHFKRNSHFQEGDVLVLFGELFQRGYANGLVEEAQRRKMRIVRTTVGRRDKDGMLRPLNTQEINESLSIPDSDFINVPLEAGFDLEPAKSGRRPVDQISEVKLSEWESAQMNFDEISESQKKGQERFLAHLKNYLKQLGELIPSGKNVYFAHLMAGGVPRAKILLPLMNRSLKGSGDRFLSSEKFWTSSMGQFVSRRFFEVTAETFHHLIQESSSLRAKIEASGGKVFYSAYGYHGTEVLVDKNYIWQTYTPYLQGWAKLRLENFARDWSHKGVSCAVYNCPEILTNSSAIFSGVEVSLYPLLGALKKEAGLHPRVEKVLKTCQSLLKSEISLEHVLKLTKSYLTSPLTREYCNFEKWPQHNRKDQLESMLKSSEELVQMHVSEKHLMTQVLSEVVIESCGKVMLNDAAHPESPVSWINHDVIAQAFSADSAKE